jgi:hypothetical protein
MLTERAGSTPGPAVLTTPSKGKEAMVTYLEASLKTANDRVRVACCTSLLLLPCSHTCTLLVVMLLLLLLLLLPDPQCPRSAKLSRVAFLL